MDVPQQSEVPDVPEGGVSHTAHSGRDKGSGYWGRHRGAILGLMQHLNVDILDNIGQEAVDEAPHSPCVVTLDVVMVEIRIDHL